MDKNTTNNPELLSDKEQGKDKQIKIETISNAIDNQGKLILLFSILLINTDCPIQL